MAKNFEVAINREKAKDMNRSVPLNLFNFPDFLSKKIYEL